MKKCVYFCSAKQKTLEDKEVAKANATTEANNNDYLLHFLWRRKCFASMIKSSCPENIFGAQCKRVNPMPMTLIQVPYIQEEGHEESQK